MKIRAGFVSNSSSSSFVIDKFYLSDYQIKLIKNHMEIAKKLEGFDLEYVGIYDTWQVSEYDDELHGSTSMDNFDMHDFLGCIGVPLNKVRWEND